MAEHKKTLTQGIVEKIDIASKLTNYGIGRNGSAAFASAEVTKLADEIAEEVSRGPLLRSRTYYGCF